jgi:hypothetical protein
LHNLQCVRLGLFSVPHPHVQREVIDLTSQISKEFAKRLTLQALVVPLQKKTLRCWDAFFSPLRLQV